jgi:hypothetical protein
MRSQLVSIARKMLASGPIPDIKYAVLRVVWKLSFQARQTDETAPSCTALAES